MNGLIEKVVKREKDPNYYVKIILTIFGMIAIPSLVFALAIITSTYYLMLVAFFIFLYAIYMAWYIISSLNVDYEYAFFTPTLNISRIVAKRKRKPMLKLDVKQFTDFFRYDDAEMSKRKFTKVFRASAKSFSEDNYVAVFHRESKGECALIFTPDEELVEALKMNFSGELRKKLFKENKL